MSSPESESELSVRAYAAGDRDWVYDVCVRTGDNGEDATGKFRDADLLPDIYAGPYLDLEPDLAFVLDGGRRPVGYVIGTADTAAFVQSYREQWIPRVAPKYPAPPAVPATPDEDLIGVFYTPERMLLPELSEFPAHLHIDVLPAHQGKGYGCRLITTFLEAVARAGANGAHVAVSPVNTRAQSFYLRVGFERLPIRDGTYFGCRL
jgi:ribosomal protein S18 acetylase RimI-like enzyme